jgi:hypothetical protein
MSKFSGIGVCVLVVLASASAVAGPLTVVSYSMYNGGAGYWDSTYLPCTAGDCTAGGAPLSGGTGKLTDGVSPLLSWNQDPAFWVGWYTGYTNGTDPTVTFSFASTVTVDSVTVWVDNTPHSGSVGLPGSVSVDGTNFPITPDNVNDGPRGYTFPVNITGNSVDVQFFQGSEPWIMVGEVSFNDSSAPEPATWALMVGGLALALLRRRRLSL